MDDSISRKAVMDAINAMPVMIDADGIEYVEKSCMTIRIETLPAVQSEVIACGSGELNDETGMEWVSNAGMLQAGEIHGSVLKTIPLFGEEDPEPKPGGK